ncbi:hypothetical protein EB118_23390 [bacterium]|nr:hypothetical protein [bacterium]NDC95801.1 hypothetical protein [bacterium]NDD85467.1 hypothetical protein [bacterium]NDG32997.1 hypothetical protein [bacterium]
MRKPNKYPSKYSNGKTVSAAQYITEIICERKAYNNKQDLHYKFWITKDWSAYYRNQIASAHKLLKTYSDTAIVKALNNKKAAKIYSLRAPHLIPLIEEEQKQLDSQNKDLSISIDRSDKKIFRQTQQQNNIISRLKDLDNEF